MTPQLSQEQKETLQKAIVYQQSIDLPTIAAQHGILFQEVETALRSDKQFYNDIDQALTALRFKLYQSTLNLALNGKGTDSAGDLAAIRFIIQEIDADRVIGRYKPQTETITVEKDELLSGLATPKNHKPEQELDDEI